MEYLKQALKDFLLLCLMTGFVALMIAFMGVADAEARGLEIGDRLNRCNKSQNRQVSQCKKQVLARYNIIGIGTPLMIVSPHGKSECFMRNLEIKPHPKTGEDIATINVFGNNCFVKKRKTKDRKLTKTLYLRGKNK